ncbi:MAG: aldehyde dehydrogenase family protein [Fidelibacterota bacterium]
MITHSLIDGEEVKTENLFSSINPFNEEPIAKISISGEREINTAVESAARAFSFWSLLSYEERGNYLRKINKIILEEIDEIARLIALEQGKPVDEAKSVDILPAMDAIKYYSKNTKRLLKERVMEPHLILFSSKRGKIVFEPLGTIAIITPWNFPFCIPIVEIAASLITGKTVVLKPSSLTPLTGLKIGDIARKAGLPPGVLNVVIIGGSDTVYLTEHPDIHGIKFTGSVGTGKKVLCSSSKNIIPTVLELGGKDPAVVAEDAPMERAVKGTVWGALFNCGQVCASIERLYVEHEIYHEFVRRCVDEVEKLKVGDPLEADTDIGPMASREQLETVKAHLKDAVEKGAKIVTGGEELSDKGFLLSPCILIDVNHTMKIMTEETFGPVIPIMSVSSIDEAIKLANESIYGLTASGWTSSKATADKLLRELKAGVVTINDSVFSFIEASAPWGGIKRSGIGRSHSVFGLLSTVNIKYVNYDKGAKRTALWWFPYDSGYSKFINSAIPALYQTSFYGKIKRLGLLLKNPRFLFNVNLWSMIKNIGKIF